jgi:protein TonB
MSRGMPYSLVLHLAALVMIVLYGAHVPSPPLRPQQVFRVRTVQLDKPQASSPENQRQAEPEAVQAVEPPTPEPQKVPAKQPEKKTVKPEPKEKEKPKPPPTKPREQESAPTTQKVPDLGNAAEHGIAGTDEPFPFAWYLDIVKGIITRNWNPPQLGIREGERTCAVHFVIERTGAITRVTLAQSSGIALLDREGIRAVQAAQTLPPLPAAFASRSLGITFVFHLRSGL